MPQYRRAHEPGGTFFFTVVTEQRVPLFRAAHARASLREAIAAARQRWPFDVDAMVLLPDHLHTVWSLPKGDADFSTRWSFLKRRFTQAWLAAGGRERPRSASRRRNRRRGVWQRRFWEHAIRNEDDYARHCDYIHYNPVKHGLVACPHEWPFSSFARFVEQGVYDSSWQCACKNRVVPPTFDDLDQHPME